MKNLAIIAVLIVIIIAYSCKKEDTTKILVDEVQAYNYKFSDTPYLGALITFTALVPDSVNDHNIVWDFGEGPVSTGKTVQFRFMKYRRHAITMRVKTDSAIITKNFDIRLDARRMGGVRKWEGKKTHPAYPRQQEIITYTGGVKVLNDSTISFYGDTFVLSAHNYTYNGMVQILLEGDTESNNHRSHINYYYDDNYYQYGLNRDTLYMSMISVSK